MLNALDLFSGIGGITYALQDWVRPVAYCEIEPFCQSVLLQRMQKGDLPQAPIWDDVRSLKRAFPYQLIDIITAGFPCQDISVAGAGKGLEGERSGLFFEIMRLAEEIKPQFLFLENVPAITSRGGLRVVREIASLGYDCRWCVISASGVGALHRRERWFLLANASSEKSTRFTKREKKEYPMSSYSSVNSHSNSIANGKASGSTMPKREKRETRGDNSSIYRPFKSRDDWQEAVSSVCRVADGLPNQVDRLKSLGNAVVPQQVRKAWIILTGLEYEMGYLKKGNHK